MSSHLVTSKILARTCPRCRTMILAGLAEGLHARVDPQPLTPAQEAQARSQDRWTYSLSRGELIYRDATRINGNSISGPILAAHQCGPPSWEKPE